MSGEPSKQALQRFQAGWRQFLRRIGMFKEQRPGPWCKYKASDPNRLWSPSVSNRTQTPRIPIPSHRTKIEGRRSMRKRNTHTHTHTHAPCEVLRPRNRPGFRLQKLLGPFLRLHPTGNGVSSFHGAKGRSNTSNDTSDLPFFWCLSMAS